MHHTMFPQSDVKPVEEGLANVEQKKAEMFSGNINKHSKGPNAVGSRRQAFPFIPGKLAKGLNGQEMEVTKAKKMGHFP